MPEKLMNIAFNVDEPFVPRMATTIASILLNSNKNDFFSFYILCTDISKDGKEKLESLKKIKNFNMDFIKITAKDFENCPVSCHIKQPAYYRLKLPSLLNIEKVLYMDSDIIVRKSLKNFYEINVEDCYAAVVQDISFKGIKIQNQLEALELENYFNSGVMLFNLKKMREDKIEEKCFDFIAKSSEKIVYHDQCVLNKILKEKLLWLDDTYNFQHHAYIADIPKRYNKIKKDVIIFHFASPRKPWLFNKPLWIIVEYYYYLLKTPFKSVLLKDFMKRSFFGKFFHKLKLTLIVVFCKV